MVLTRCALSQLVQQFANVAKDLKTGLMAMAAHVLTHVTRTTAPVPSPIHSVQQFRTAPLVDATQTLITTS